MRPSPTYVPLFVVACVFSLPLTARSDDPQASARALENTAVFPWEHRVSGTVVRLKGTTAEIETRDKRVVPVDAAPAIESHRAYSLAVGAPITAFGSYDPQGVLHAKGVTRAKRLPAAWPVDR